MCVWVGGGGGEMNSRSKGDNSELNAHLSYAHQRPERSHDTY